MIWERFFSRPTFPKVIFLTRYSSPLGPAPVVLSSNWYGSIVS